MKISAESYLRGPVSASSITEVLCYSSKATGLIVNQNNLSEISGKVLDLGITVNRNYLPVKLRGQEISISPSKNLAFSPSSGFDTLIYYVKLDEHRKRFPIGFSKLSQVIGNTTITAVESIHYKTIIVKLENLGIIDEYVPSLIDIGDENLNISDPQKNYLLDFKNRKNLDYSIHVEEPLIPTNSATFRLLPYMIINQEISETGKFYWEENKKVPAWIESRGIRIQKTNIGEDQYLFLPIFDNKIRYVEIPTTSIASNSYSGEENYDEEDNFRNYRLPRFISHEFIVDENGGLWSYPFLSDSTYATAEGKTLRCMAKSDSGEVEIQTEGQNYGVTFPISTSMITQQPLLDLSNGILVSKESIFENVFTAQNRVRDVVNTIIPLTLLFADNGKLWIKLKIGAWFVFDLPQYGIEVVQNRTTAIVVPRKDCQFYPINDKSILVRTPRGLSLFNTAGEWCDSYTMDTVVSRFPQSNLLRRFSVGGDLVDETDIFNGPLNRYRRGILPKGKINIIGALDGIIIYYQIRGDNQVFINYL
jgi:hypothetical protein